MSIFNDSKFNNTNFNMPAVKSVSTSFSGNSNSFVALNHKIIRSIKFNSFSENNVSFYYTIISSDIFKSINNCYTNFSYKLLVYNYFDSFSFSISNFFSMIFKYDRLNSFCYTSYQLDFNIYDYMANLRTFFPHLNYMAKEKDYKDFIQGEHIVSKAYDNDDNDYLGFTDDYDFCWGPVNEGEPLTEYVRGYDDNGRLIIKAQEYGPANGRLWGVYTKSAGEIYLLKANEDLTAWERHEKLTFVPSGSRRATIEFKPDGHYELAVEFIPAGSDTYEIWVISYPYEGDNIRRVANGTEPQLTSDFNNNPVLFYSDNEQYNLFYREQYSNYDIESKIENVFMPERKLHFRYASKATKPTGMGVGDNGYIIAFYNRDDDYKPYKYVTTGVLDVLNSPLYIENYNLDEVNLNSIDWVELTETEISNFESYELENVNLNNINWVNISAIEINNNKDKYELENVNLNNINWVNISAIEINNNKDKYELENVNLDSILWVEV